MANGVSLGTSMARIDFAQVAAGIKRGNIEYSPTTGEVTIMEAGTYELKGRIHNYGNISGHVLQISARVNGSSWGTNSQSQGGTGNQVNIEITGDFAAGTKLSIWAQNSVATTACSGMIMVKLV